MSRKIIVLWFILIFIVSCQPYENAPTLNKYMYPQNAKMGIYKFVIDTNLNGYDKPNKKLVYITSSHTNFDDERIRVYLEPTQKETVLDPVGTGIEIVIVKLVEYAKIKKDLKGDKYHKFTGKLLKSEKRDTREEFMRTPVGNPDD